MSLLVFFAALGSAFLHACWNATAKKRALASDALSGIVIASAIFCALAVPFVGLPPAKAWVWIATGAFCNVVFVRSLMEAYDRTKFAIAYPVARSVIPPLMYVIGWSVFGESANLFGLGGLILVLISIVLFTFQTQRLSKQDSGGLVFALISGVAVTLALALDTKGVRVIGTTPLAVLQYGVWSSIAVAAALTVVSHIENRAPLRFLKRDGFACFFGAALLLVSYFLGLWAYAQGPVGLVAPLREMNILFAGLLAVIFLGEPVSSRQWCAIGVATLGALLIKVSP